ncbi:MAG: hypothetical protein KGZ59_05865 [Chitinophagaceae bacterium]|nr:hypothetical protein [Chitinophagaceae bacterium]
MFKHRFSHLFTILVFTGFGFSQSLQPKPVKLIKDIPVLIKISNGNNIDDYQFTYKILKELGFEIIDNSDVETVINNEVRRRLSGMSFANGIDIDYHKNQITNGNPIYQVLSIKTTYHDSLSMDSIKEFTFKVLYIPKGGVNKFPNQSLHDSIILKNDKQLLLNQMLNIIAK